MHQRRRTLLLCKAVGFTLAVLVSIEPQAADCPPPTLKDMQIAGRVLGFQEVPPSGGLSIAVAYNGADPQSRREALAIVSLLQGGLAVGGLVLRPVLLEQAHLVGPQPYGAVFAAAGVSAAALKAGLDQHRTPCLTLHLEQVQHGACTVAIRSEPSVAVIVSDLNAAAVGVRFATAFRMMVQEI